MSIVTDVIQPSHSLSPPVFPSIRVFFNELALCNRWPKDWSFSSSISLSNKYSRLVSFRSDSGASSGLICLQSKGLSRVSSSTTVQNHQFFHTQPSLWSNAHPSMTTGKTIALNRWTFVGKVMSLLFNKRSRFVIAFLPRSKHLLISWPQSPSVLILKPKKMKSDTVSTFSHLFTWSVGTRCHDLQFLKCWVLTQRFHSPLSPSSRGCLIPLHFLT